MPFLGLVLLASSASLAGGILDAKLDSAFLVKGEVTRLSLELEDRTRPASQPVFLPNPDLQIKFLQDGLRILRNRKKLFIYTYSIQSFKEGTHLVPTFRITTTSGEAVSQPLPIRIAPLSELTLGTRKTGRRDLRYYSAVFAPDEAPYQGETFPAEVKVYLPETANAGMAELDHPGLVAWRFEAIPSLNRVVLPTGNHFGLTFRSTASPIRSGEVTLGPGRARIVLRTQRVQSGFTLWENVPVDFDIPARQILTRALPPGAPAGFNGAVGRFSIQSSADTDELEEGDPIAIRLTVTGRGNLDTLPAPTLDAPAGEWKSYEPSRLERQDERRDVTGTVRFSQIIRPLATQPEIPSFQLVYFDPGTAGYETARTAPILFKTRPGKKSSPSVAVIPTLSTPVEDMQGILGLVDPLRPAPSSSGMPWLRWWQLLPATLGLLLLAHLLRHRVLPRFRRSERERQVLAALAEIDRPDSDAGAFLRSSGSFIERWIPPDERSDLLKELLTRRDVDCFRPNIGDLAIDRRERSEIIRSLKTLALNTGRTLAVAAIMLGGISPGEEPSDSPGQLHRQAEHAWSMGNYRIALELYTQTNPDPIPSANLLYNLGNCHYQLGEPGIAALHYHRALLQNPKHPEAKQNLRFLETKLGSITILRRPYERALARLDRKLYGNVLLAGGWTTALAILALFAFPSRIGRFGAFCGFASGTLLTAAATACFLSYPDDAEFAPLDEQAIVTSSARIEARTEASTAGNKVIDAPPGSRCRILAPRGPWTYVEFANLTRGWLPATSLTPLVPPATKPEQRL